MTYHQLYEHIKLCLKEGIPQSILRVGDGEKMILNGVENYPDMCAIMEKFVGYVPDRKKMMAVRERLIDALAHCDIIGVPVNNRFLNDPNSHWSQVIPVLNKYVKVNAILSDIDFHSRFLDNNWYDELFKSVDEVYYISCRNISEALLIRYPNLKTVGCYHVAPEMKFSPEYKGVKHLDDIDNVKNWIDSQDLKGKLCLFGAGAIGKIYGNWMRDKGGIAVDIGSVFDHWYGLRTRGKGRGAGVIDETYKL